MRLSRAALLFHRVLLCTLGVIFAARADAQCVSVTSAVPVLQTFDALASTGTNVAWSNNVTISGGQSTRATYNAGTGSSNTGSLYSFGTTTDRAIGGVASGGTGTFYWGLCFTNDTGAALTSFDIAYIGEQWRDGGNAVPVAQTMVFEYQVAAAGVITGINAPTTGWAGVAALNFTSPTFGATAAALDGNAPANRASKSATIPTAVPVGQQVWVRWTDVNDAGNDHGLAVDDFSITLGAGGPPSIAMTVNDVNVVEGNSGSSLATFTVSLSAPAPAGGVTFDIATSDGTATSGSGDYVAKALTAQTIAAGDSSYSFDVQVNGDTLVEPNETFFVNIANATGTDVVVSDGQGLGTIGTDDFSLTAIHDIQGPGATSPVVGSLLATTGVVTAVKANGFFIQEPDASIDADPATSEGIFVFTSTTPPAAAAVHNMVTVKGTVSEFSPSTDLYQPPVTELVGPEVFLISTGAALPNPIYLATNFPDPTGAFDQLERLEGMRVGVGFMTVVSATGGFKSEANATSTTDGAFQGVVQGVARPFREPGIQQPDPAPAGSAGFPTIPQFDTNPEVIRVDSDALTGSTAINVATGATVSNIEGVLDYAFRRYTILPDPSTVPDVSGGLVSTPVRPTTAREFTIASFNLERFYDDINDTGDNAGDAVLTTTAYQNRLNKASRIIREKLLSPDIIGIEEVESLKVLNELATRINDDAFTATGVSPQYAAALEEGNDVGAIDVGFLYRVYDVGGVPRVAVNSLTQVGKDTLFSNPDSTTSPLNDRPPYVMEAVVTDSTGTNYPVTVIVNHLRSLNDVNTDGAGTGTNDWTTLGTRVRAKRYAQAKFLADYVQGRQTSNPNENIVLVGDFNSFAFNDGYGDSINDIIGLPGNSDATVVDVDGATLVEPHMFVLQDTSAPDQNYSYVFDGNAQTLDHVIISNSVVNSTEQRELRHARVNADFPEILRGTSPDLRLSDHDPAIAYFVMPEVFPEGSPTLDSINSYPSSDTTAELYAYVQSEGSSSITQRGFVYSPTSNPPVIETDSVNAQGGSTGEMYATLSSLTPNTTYHARGFATNDAGTAYTATTTFTTYCTYFDVYVDAERDEFPVGALGRPYSLPFYADGGTAPHTWTFTGLPEGIAGNGASVEGTPTEVGEFHVHVEAKDANGCVGSWNYSFTVGKAAAAGDIVISEFRLRGPYGSDHEYIELANRSDVPVVIFASDESAGWSIARAGDRDPDDLEAPPGPAQRVITIPNGTVIGRGGHWLANAACECPRFGHDYYSDIPDDYGIAIFDTDDEGAYATATPIDAVGSALDGEDKFHEGAPLPILGDGNVQYEVAWVRRHLTSGVLADSGSNNKDFVFVAPDAGDYGPEGEVKALLGGSDPEDLDAPHEALQGEISSELYDTERGEQQTPNRAVLREEGSLYLEYRRVFTNNTHKNIDALGFKVIDLTTTNSRKVLGNTQADLRVMQSGGWNDAVPTYLAYESDYPASEGGLNSIVYVDLYGGDELRAPGQSVVRAKDDETLAVNFRARVASPGYYLFAILPLIATFDEEGGGGEQEVPSLSAGFSASRPKSFFGLKSWKDRFKVERGFKAPVLFAPGSDIHRKTKPRPKAK